MDLRQGHPELWGGMECTINRVDDSYFDQYAWAGHRRRGVQDLERLASLGIGTLRLGLQWEHHEATGSWASFDATLAGMHQLRLRPIAGLLHHGSGPPHTSLLDPHFPDKLAAYALQVAQRYPWILDYTPVNEPQTTARFACLYGHWFPHHRNMASYVRALYQQVKGIALSMAAIRSVQPAARLIHTEDAGATFATPELERFRVEREHRRWLGTDLLCGVVVPGHPLYQFLLQNGLGEAEISWFAERPCEPSILGLNYYVTSDRFLDHRFELYPSNLPGGDAGDEPLVDIEAVRVRAEGILGIGAILREAWDRYRLPVAVTEAHLGSDEENQLRWLAEIWREAQQARVEGVDVRAVTVWALLGSWNWSNLCTEDLGLYEAGAFCLRDGELHSTRLASFVRQLAQTGSAQAGVPPGEGWWRHLSRLCYPPLAAESPASDEIREPEEQLASLVGRSG